jgi:tRNA pseudouridine55 synthase
LADPVAAVAGGLLIDKPAGVTSFDVVRRVRRERDRGVKIGHAGTLDPFATGLLIVLLGRATRLQRYLLSLPKTYMASARLGWRSSTGDPDGELTHTDNVPERLELPTGPISQRVPMTSAVKVGGERLYRKAHRGETIETPEREVTVYEARLLEAEGEYARFELTVSAGTYVRTLIETLGDAYCSDLRRTAIGPHRIEDCSDQRLLSPLELLAHMPRLKLEKAKAERLGHGVAVPVTGNGAGEGEVMAAVRGGQLVAVCRIEGGLARPEVVLI